MKTIVIFHPSHYFGGVSVLYSRIYTEISLNNVCEVKIIDYADGFIKTRKTNDEANNFIEFPCCDKKSESFLKNTDDYVVLMASTQVEIAKKYFSEYSIDPIILVGVYHPFEASLQFTFKARRLLSYFNYELIKKYQYFFPISKNKVSKFVKRGINLKGLYFMDIACYNATSYFLNLNEKYSKEVRLVPVPVPVPVPTSLEDKPRKRMIKSFGYVGRVEDFKTRPLIKFISDINNLDLDEAEIHIIGNGKDLDSIEELAKSEFTNVNIIFYGSLSNEESQKVMRDYVDIAGCMGTAALDTASLGIPTIILNPLEKKVVHYTYNWLHLNKNYVLGDYADAPWFIDNGKALKELVQEADENYLTIAIDSKNYVRENHSVDIVCQTIVNLADESLFRLSDVPFGNINILKSRKIISNLK